MEENESLLVSDSTGDESDECEPPPSSGTAPSSHTVVFKCIGAVRDTQSQRVLYQAKNKLDSGWTVPVRMRPEPTNIRDARAVVFECKLEDKWQKILGMLSKTFLTRFHSAISCRDQVSMGEVHN